MLLTVPEKQARYAARFLGVRSGEQVHFIMEYV